MREGNVILLPMLQADGTEKIRPAVMLRELPRYGDFLTCGISTKLRQAVAGFDEIIAPPDLDFASSGLVAESVIRVGYLSAVSRTQIQGIIGVISPDRHERLLRNLSRYLIERCHEQASRG